MTASFAAVAQAASERAGEDGVSADTRWVTGTGVVLRVAGDPRATVLERIGLNRRVRLRAPAAGDWCDVRTEQGATGFIACDFLAEEPVDIAALSTPLGLDGQPNPHYDPARLFWMEPGWWRLEAYAQSLAERHRDAPVGQRWPRDAELERMKADLANGHVGAAPAAMADWAELRRAVAALPKSAAADDPQRGVVGNRLQTELGLWWGDAGTAIAVAQVLQLPAVRASWFRNERELAAPTADAEALSGRFGIVQRWTTSARPQPAVGEEDYGSAGLYDMLARTQSLVRPVQRVQLYRDGRVDAAPTYMRSSETLYREYDEEECNGFVGGFAYGDADPAIWNYYNYGDEDYGSQARIEAGKPPGLLYEFAALAAPPKLLATVSRREQRLDRATTGFVHGLTLVYDLDHDAVPDLLVWEGTGHGPGHMDGETTTDDAWYRLVFVNVAGRWKILGTDTFGYGCGC